MGVVETTKRAEIRSAFQSERWWKQVDKMSDRQVHAIYMRLKNERKI